MLQIHRWSANPFSREIDGHLYRVSNFDERNAAVHRFLAAGHVKTKRGEDKYEFAAGIEVCDLVSRKWLVNRIVDSGALQYSSSKHRTIEPEFLNYTSNGKRLTVFQGGFVRILDAASLAAQLHIDQDDLPLYAMRNEQAHVWDMKVGSIKFWDIDTGKLTREISDAPAGIHDYVDVSKDGKILLRYVGLNKNSGHFMTEEARKASVVETRLRQLIETAGT